MYIFLYNFDNNIYLHARTIVKQLLPFKQILIVNWQHQLKIYLNLDSYLKFWIILTNLTKIIEIKKYYTLTLTQKLMEENRLKSFTYHNKNVCIIIS
jgi:hypothetical protein